MTADRWIQIERLFSEAVDLAPDARVAFLDAVCRAPDGSPDVALREEVERLLALDDSADDFLAEPPGSPPPIPASTPDHVGPWRIERKVGEGGMGEVYLAERNDGAFRQRAAVKLVRPGLGADLLARFRAERHVLARLEHPAIARLLDGGTAPDGRPYLALEYVDGEPITAYCDRRRLGVNERLALFGDVCTAVAAAHRQLVVHRDLKPSNVLVTEEGAVKLLDFGIAKLLDDAAPFTVAVTRADQRVMTPEYAAPETVRGEPATTTTDVYGLGVLLYELLTGRRPYHVPRHVRQAIERAILEDEPTEPSTAVLEATQTDAEPAEARGLSPDRLRRRLRGDLDRIVLKALRKEPGRRYGSAEALAADVERHLEGLPVEARPASIGYRVGRFVRRHRAGVGVTLVLVALGVAYLTTAAAQARRIAQERDRATAVTDLLVGLFDGGDPAVAQGDTLTALALLDSAAARLDTALAGQPALRADLQLALGRIYLQQGAFGRADSLLTPALAWRRQSASPLALADALTAAASADYWLGRYAEGEQKHQEALAIEEAAFDPPHPALAARLNHLGVARSRLGDYPGARAFQEQALDQYRRLGEDLAVARSLRQLAVLDYYTEDHERSDRRLREALPLLEAGLGPGHPDVVMTRREHAWAIGGLGRPEEAVAMLQAVHEDNLRLYGEGHPTVPNTLGELSRYQREAGDLAGSEASAREGLRIIRQLYGNDHQYVANNALDLAVVLRDLGRYDEARALAEEALAIHRATLGPDHPFTGSSLGHVARLAALQGDREAAIRTEREALRVLEDGYGADHPRTDSSRARLRRLLADG